MIRGLSTLSGATLVIGAALAAQQVGPVVPDQRPPVTFRAQSNLVEIDVIVTDRDGRFVTGLTRDDFELFEEGEPQRISAFSLVQIPTAPAASPAGDLEPEPDAVSNRVPFNGRIFLLLLDDLHTSSSSAHYVRTTARTFVERYVSTGDLAAVFFTSSRTDAQDFTSSRPRLLAAIDRFDGTMLRSARAVAAEDAAMNQYVLATDNPPPGLAASHVEHQISRATMSLNVVAQMADFLGAIPGRRKSVVYFGGGPVKLLPTDPSVLLSAMDNAVAASTRANTSVYRINPRGFSEHGSLFERTQGIESSLARVAEDGSNYYLLGYPLPEGRQPGRFREVQVRVKRPGLNVRARPGYFVPAAPAARHAEETSAVKASPGLRAALRSPLPSEGLTFAVSAPPFVGKAGKASVALVVEVDPARIAFGERRGEHHADLELQVTATDPIAKPPINSTHHLARLRLRPATYDAVRREGVRIIRRLDLPPGRHRLQIGVRDTNGGAVGTLFTDLDVPNFTKAPLGMSGVVIVSAAATRMPTVEPDAALSAVLPGAHTARREFPVNDTLAVFAEVYVNGLSTASPVHVTSTVFDAQRREVFAAREEYGGASGTRASSRRAEPERFGHRVTIPAERLGVGQFVLRMQAQTSTGETPVIREIPFSIR